MPHRSALPGAALAAAVTLLPRAASAGAGSPVMWFDIPSPKWNEANDPWGFPLPTVWEGTVYVTTALRPSQHRRSLVIMPGTTVVFVAPEASLTLSNDVVSNTLGYWLQPKITIAGGNISDPSTRITFSGANIAVQGLIVSVSGAAYLGVEDPPQCALSLTSVIFSHVAFVNFIGPPVQIAYDFSTIQQLFQNWMNAYYWNAFHSQNFPSASCSSASLIEQSNIRFEDCLFANNSVALSGSKQFITLSTSAWTPDFGYQYSIWGPHCGHLPSSEWFAASFIRCEFSNNNFPRIDAPLKFTDCTFHGGQVGLTLLMCLRAASRAAAFSTWPLASLSSVTLLLLEPCQTPLRGSRTGHAPPCAL